MFTAIKNAVERMHRAAEIENSQLLKIAVSSYTVHFLCGPSA